LDFYKSYKQNVVLIKSITSHKAKTDLTITVINTDYIQVSTASVKVNC